MTRALTVVACRPRFGCVKTSWLVNACHTFCVPAPALFGCAHFSDAGTSRGEVPTNRKWVITTVIYMG